MTADVAVVGGGHNGLVCACYLADAGLDVVVLEQADAPGGGSRSEATVPAHRFDTHSAAHNIINMTTIVDDLALTDAGLRYVEMDPFAVALFRDGRRVRFHRDIGSTVAALRTVDPVQADRYAAFMRHATAVLDVMMAGVDTDVAAGIGGGLRQLWSLARLLATDSAVGVAHDVLRPYASVLDAHLGADLVSAPVAAFAAHGGAAPSQVGTGLFVLWQAAYHRYGQWHALGGAQSLTDALVARLGHAGGTVRTAAPVRRIATRDGTVQGVELADGERIPASTVVAATAPEIALLDLLDPPLGGAVARSLRAAHRANAVQMVVHLALDRLPTYPHGRPGDHHGLQSYVDRLGDLRAGFAAAEAGRLPPDPVPTYAFTPSALDDGLAPSGAHTMYLACPCAPFAVDGGWPRHADAFADRMIDTVAAVVPGFRDTIVGRHVRTPAMMADQLRWPGAHPMVLDVTIDQLAWLRPTPELSRYETPVRGLFLTGAATRPMGGISGIAGRAAARRLLARHGTPGRARR